MYSHFRITLVDLVDAQGRKDYYNFFVRIKLGYRSPVH
jgi:hypothetical protein